MSDPPVPSLQFSLEGFTALLDRCQWPLYTFLRGMVGDDEQARDLLQDAFCDAWRTAQQGIPPFVSAGNNEAGMRRWLFHAAYCRAELVIYDRVEASLRRAMAPSQGATPPFTREAIARHLLDHPATSRPSVPPIPADTPPQQKKRVLSNVSALAATLILILLAALLFRLPGMHRPPVGQGVAPVDLTQVSLNGISMVSPEEGWAVGVTQLSQKSVSAAESGYGAPVILHYWHGQWWPTPLPPTLINRLGCGTQCPGIMLRSLSMISPTEGWVVGNTVLRPGSDGATTGIVLHYTGGQWVLDSLRDAALFSVFMRTASDGWIVGEGQSGWSGSQGNAPVFHYTSSAWTPVNDPALAHISAQTLVALSATNVWLAGIAISGSGFDGNDPEEILHFNGNQWVREQTDLANSRLSALAMLSPTQGWAVGSLAGGMGPAPTHPQRALVEQYVQGQWRQDTTFAGPAGSSSFGLAAIAMVSADEGWAVGSDGLIVHLLHGSWSRVPSPTGQTLWSLAFVSPTQGWAVGEQGTILHYANGVWHLSSN